MNCFELNEHLSAYADGELDPGLSALVRTHLSACSSCRARLQEMDRVWELLGGYKSVEAPPGFDGSVRERIEEGMMPARRTSIRKVWAVGAVAAAVLCAFGIFSWLSGAGSGPDVPGTGTAVLDEQDEGEILGELERYPGFLELLSGLEVAEENEVDIDLLENLEIIEDSESGAGSRAEEYDSEETAMLPGDDSSWSD